MATTLWLRLQKDPGYKKIPKKKLYIIAFKLQSSYGVVWSSSSNWKKI